MGFFRSLRFSVLQKENDFAKSRMPALVKSLQLGAALLCFLIPVNAVFAAIGGNLSGPHRSPTLFMLGVDAAAFFIYLGVYLYLRTPSIEIKKSPTHLERLAIAMFLLAILISCATDGFRTARLFGVDPEAAWNRNICQFTDSTYALRLDGIVTAVGVFVPIRSHLLPVIPTAAAVSFVVASTLLGSSETPSQVASNTLILTVMGYMVCVGGRMTEARERERFQETSEVRKQMVTEKIARFDLEHRIERTNLSSQRQGIVEAGADEGGPVPTTVGTAEDSNSNSQPASGTAGKLTDGTLDLSSTSSILGASTAALRISARKDVGTDPVCAVGEDKATDPLLVWSEAGWKCQRCSKPPLPPVEGLRRQNSNSGISSCSSGRADPQARNFGASSSGSGAVSLDGPPQLSCFELTPKVTLQQFLKDMLQTLNCKRGIAGICCPYHTAVSYVQKASKVLQKEPCQPLWTPFTQDQCKHCLSMLDFKMEPGLSCEVCGFEMPSRMQSL